jgi:hypothetical protein
VEVNELIRVLKVIEMVKDLLSCFLRQLSLDLVEGVKVLSQLEVLMLVVLIVGFTRQFFRFFNLIGQLF